MKSINKLFWIFLVLSIGFLSSCDDNEGKETPPEPVITEVLLKLSKLQAASDGVDAITFTSSLPDGTDVTAEAEFFVDDVKLASNSFTSTEIGEHKAYASFKSVKSTVATITIVNHVTQVILNMDKTKAVSDGVELVTFTAALPDGTDVTAKSEFFVDNTKLTSNTFTSTTVGEFEVYASFQGVNSDVASLKFIGTAPGSYTTKILVEDYTGTWCGYCPRIAYKLDEAIKANGNIIGVGVHSGDNMEFSRVKLMENKFDVDGYPTAVVNRRTKWGEGQSQLDIFLNKSAPLGLAISSEQNGDDLNVNVKVGFKNEMTAELKLVVYIVEDGLIANQRNYMNGDTSSPWYAAGDPIVDFEHNHVLRVALTDIFGDGIPLAVMSERNTYSVDLSINTSEYEAANLSVVAFVVESSSKNIQNVQIAKAGTAVDFD